MIERKNIFTPSVLLGLKVFLLFVLVLVFQGPLYSIKSLVHEREDRSNAAEIEVIGHYGGQQVISGPVLVISYREIIDDEEYLKTAFYTPDELQIHADMSTEIRKRGIFDVPVYSVTARMDGFFTFPDLSEFAIDPDKVVWENSYICFDLTDMRSITGDIQCTWNGAGKIPDGGPSKTGIYEQAVFFRPEKLEKGGKYPFGIAMNLRGGRQLNFVAMGRKNSINIVSDWTSPSFNGSRLPDTHDITDSGFTANWSVLALSRNFPDSWNSDQNVYSRIISSQFGFMLYSSLDHYLLSERSVKYGLLFIILPFICFFLFETVWKLRIHIFQYLLVGVFESLFFLLLLSLSEHTGFTPAFLTAALLTTAAISYYANVFVRDFRKTLFIAVILAISFLFLFIIIRNEDYALLIGSSGIFLIALIVMFVTRRVNWYELGKAFAKAGKKNNAELNEQ
ncbi:MAG: cell envelope integrity protein CreD [Spirochaetales bacterium]|nr:cell envelope integrity protein CreD [Spirochaetales bacterium]